METSELIWPQTSYSVLLSKYLPATNIQLVDAWKGELLLHYGITLVNYVDKMADSYWNMSE